jgi:hypothetical protein
LTVGASAVPAHLAHGDSEGHCYVCANGVPAAGGTPNANTNKCASCDRGYQLRQSDKSCGR